jgi:hypothetical protein
MIIFGIAVAVAAFVIADIIAVQGPDLSAFNNSRAFPLYTKAIERLESAEAYYMKRGREIKQVSGMPLIYIAERMRFPFYFEGRFLPA